jgi:acyl-CoA synthetase (AMP-forming)/AMP-acid ligase II
MLVGEIVQRNARRYHDKTALVFEDVRLTWGQVNRRVNALANSFRKLGLSTGDRLAVLSMNCHQCIELFFTYAKSGVIGVPLNYRLSGRELEYIINNVEAQAIVVSNEYADAFKSIKNRCPSVKWVVGMGPGHGFDLDYEELVAQGDPSEPLVPLNENDIYTIFYTSGTTGLPKGAMINHKNRIANIINQQIAEKGEPSDINLTMTPLYHIGAEWVAMGYMYLGCTNIITRTFDALDFMRIVERERITICLFIAATLLFVINHPDFGKYDLSSLKLIIYGGGPMPEAVLRQAMEKIGCDFIGGYGQTETSPLATVMPIADHILDSPEKVQRLRSVGKEATNVWVKIADDNDNELPPGEIGEIVVKGDNVMKGYWRNPEETAETLKGGWCHTGDMGSKDKDGYFYIHDRKKDMIISGGENIYSKEVEDVLYSHPKIMDAAVIAIPDDVWGESVCAHIVLKRDERATEGEIIEYCKKHLASYKKPKKVVFVDDLPRNPGGKILKKVIRGEYWEGKLK